MSADIANWLLVNIVNNPQVFRSLIALIILIVAIFLFSRKPAEKGTFRRGLGASLFVFAIFVFLHANIADLADVFIAWASIVLAGIAALSFEESRQIRKQYREREEKDRKERLLNEIIEWAIDYRTCLYSPDVLGKGQKTVYAITHLKIVSVNARRQKMETFAQKVFGDDLFNDVYRLETSVVHYLAALEFIIGIDEKYISLDEYKKSEIRDKIKGAQAQGREEIDTVLDEYVQALVKAATNLIEKCSALITQL